MINIDKWTILPNKVINKKDSLFRFRTHNIVYLDDHKMYRDGVKKYCIDKYFPNAAYIEFINGNEALLHVIRQMQLNIAIDLIITDINHPGLSGDKFVEMVRYLEKAYNRMNKIPIMIISMVDNSYYVDRLINPDNPLVNYYLTKTAPIDLIVHCFEEVLL